MTAFDWHYGTDVEKMLSHAKKTYRSSWSSIDNILLSTPFARKARLLLAFIFRAGYVSYWGEHFLLAAEALEGMADGSKKKLAVSSHRYA